MIWGIDENEKRPNDDEPRNASMLIRVVVVVDMPAFYTADNDCYKKMDNKSICRPFTAYPICTISNIIG